MYTVYVYEGESSIHVSLYLISKFVKLPLQGSLLSRQPTNLVIPLLQQTCR